MPTLVVHSDLNNFGGAERVALVIVETLLNQFDEEVWLLTPRDLDIPLIQQRTGLKLGTGRLKLHTLGPVFGRISSAMPPLLSYAFLSRKARRLARNTDVAICTVGEMDFGKPAVQYVHHPLFADRSLLRKYDAIPANASKVDNKAIRGAYTALNRLVSGNWRPNYGHSLTMTNSRFMRGIIEEAYGIQGIVLYPGFLPTEPEMPSNEREGFIVMGRISPEKHTLTAIDHFEAIANIAPRTRFAIIGAMQDAEYFDQLESRVSQSNLIVDIETDLSRQALLERLRSFKYFINPKPMEHFGIATIEAISEGCIPLVHRSGGSLEIVPMPELQFDSSEDLARRVKWLLQNPVKERQVHATLLEHARRFTKDRFVDNFMTALISFRKGSHISA